jgi:hypothetical protein
MLRSGQFSLAYLIVESVWVALAVCFAKYFYDVSMDLSRESLHWSGLIFICAALFFSCVAVGGIFNFEGMRAGALIGVLLLVILNGLFIAAAVNG